MKHQIKHQLIVNMPYNLIHFLIKEKAFEKFVNNSTHYLNLNKSRFSNQFIAGLSRRFAIAQAFTWKNTKEGHCFWNDVHFKYIKYYEQETRHRKMA